MKKAEIDFKEFMSYTKIKPGIVHIHKGIVYKHSPNTEELITKIDETKAHPVFNHIITPIERIYVKDNYFGYNYRFNDQLHKVEDAIYLKRIKDIDKFLLELITIIEQLNSLNLYYWDFHHNNIFADQLGKPFLIDIDDMRINASELHKYHQAKYLTEYLINLYLEQDKTLIHLYKNPVVQTYLSERVKNYMLNLIGRTGTCVELPYCIIEEFQNKDKTEHIKTKIKQLL